VDGFDGLAESDVYAMRALFREFEMRNYDRQELNYEDPGKRV